MQIGNVKMPKGGKFHKNAIFFFIHPNPEENATI